MNIKNVELTGTINYYAVDANILDNTEEKNISVTITEVKDNNSDSVNYNIIAIDEEIEITEEQSNEIIRLLKVFGDK